jgi:AMP deaminase
MVDYTLPHPALPIAPNVSSNLATHFSRLPLSLPNPDLYSQPHTLTLSPVLNSGSGTSKVPPLKPEMRQVYSTTMIPNQSLSQTSSTAPEVGALAGNYTSGPTSTSAPGTAPEQKIFPGIVHARVRKGSVIGSLGSGTGAGIAEESDGYEQSDGVDHGNSSGAEQGRLQNSRMNLEPST